MITHYMVKIKDDCNIEGENILKAKNYYFTEDFSYMINDFIEENEKRGAKIEKEHIILYEYRI